MKSIQLQYLGGTPVPALALGLTAHQRQQASQAASQNQLCLHRGDPEVSLLPAPSEEPRAEQAVENKLTFLPS